MVRLILKRKSTGSVLRLKITFRGEKRNAHYHLKYTDMPEDDDRILLYMVHACDNIFPGFELDSVAIKRTPR